MVLYYFPFVIQYRILPISMRAETKFIEFMMHTKSTKYTHLHKTKQNKQHKKSREREKKKLKNIFLGNAYNYTPPQNKSHSNIIICKYKTNNTHAVTSFSCVRVMCVCLSVPVHLLHARTHARVYVRHNRYRRKWQW